MSGKSLSDCSQFFVYQEGDIFKEAVLEFAFGI
jgi:hypothetical protein